MRKLMLWILVLVILAAFGTSIVYAVGPYFNAARTLSEITGVKPGKQALPTFTPVPTRDSIQMKTPVRLPTPAPTAVKLVTPKQRTNFLILASDDDSKFIQSGTKLSATSGVFPNTQVMIFVSFDPVHKQVYMISIPRDLWVQIPGYGYNKISLAAGYGDISAAINTVENNFGVSIDHYAWVGLTGFIKIVDSVGGIDLNVIHPMIENDFPDDIQQPDNPNAYRRFFIPPGPVHMDGQTAELYVRARHSDLLADFGRSQRQQQVLLVLRKKVQQRVDAGDLNLAAVLAQDLQGEALTDMTVPDLLGLAHSLLGIPSSSIHRWVLTNYTTDNPNEQLATGGTTDALEPNWDRIRPLFACVDSEQALTGCPGL